VDDTVGNPGRYDRHAEAVRDVTKARVVVLLVLDGEHGNGFSVTGKGADAVEAVQSGEVSYMLRAMADIILGNPPDGVRITPPAESAAG
jgi:hypothetical protein